MRQRLESSLALIGLTLALAVLGTNAWLSYRNTHELIAREDHARHTQLVLTELERAFAGVTNAVAAQRGYLLSGDESFLKPIEPARGQAQDAVRRLRELAADPDTAARVTALGSAVDATFVDLDQGVAARRAGGAGPAAGAGVTADGKARVDAVRDAVAAAQAHEQRLLRDAATASRASLERTHTTLVVATAIAMATVLLSYALVRRDQRRRERFAREQDRLAHYNRLLVESTGEGIYGVDLDGNCTFVNAAGERILGVKAADVVGRPMHQMTHHHRPDGAPYPAEECPIYRAFKTGVGCRVDDEFFFRPDGSKFPVEYSAYPITDRGRTGGAVVTFVDISQRRRTEQGMRLRESALRAIAQGVFITDPGRDDEPIVFVNASFEQMTGFARHEVKGREIDTLGGPETDPAEIAALRAAMAAGREHTAEVLLYRKDRTAFWATVSLAPVAERGAVTHFVGVLTDVTERRRAAEDLRAARDEAELAREQAEAANVAKSQFLANMSHELRTPLNAVIMYSELLQEEAEDAGVTSFIPDLEKIRGAGKHLLALVNGVLDLSKIEAGKMDLHLETFDVRQMLDDVVATVQPLVQKGNNRLEVHAPPDLGPMYADLTKVRQVLFNLLSNASKFTQGGAVNVAVEPETEPGGAQLISFRVTDTGLGITPEQLDKLFQPFTQADASTTRKFGGTGLGLAISKRFCEMMGGGITATSEFGRGSTFVVRLPTRIAVAGPADVAATPPRANGPATTVLIVDDDSSVRDILSRALASESLRTVTAADGEAGLRLARQIHPDLIFLDVMMPKMDGWAVLTALKNDAETADIPVVMLTLVNEREMGYLLGASEYLQKPVDRDRLLDVIHKYRSKGGESEVLVVDDDPPTREVVRRSLARQGWAVAEAANGREALERVRQRVPSLILLDLMMPEMDGFEFLSELRKDHPVAAVPVVVLTSKDLSTQERAWLTGKVERIVQKGTYTREALLHEVRRIAAECAKRGQDCPDTKGPDASVASHPGGLAGDGPGGSTPGAAAARPTGDAGELQT